jgi:ketosteroid isomerase-like protein
MRADGPEPGIWTGLDGLAEGTRYRLNAWRSSVSRRPSTASLSDAGSLGEHGPGALDLRGLGPRSSKDSMARHADYAQPEVLVGCCGILPRAMSERNIGVVQASFEAWNAGDMDAFREMYHPKVIMRMAEGWPEPGPYVGREAVMRQIGQMRATWEGDTIEPISDFIDAADRVVVRFTWRGAGRGPEANIEVTSINTVRKGRIFEIEFFWNHADALEVLGLSDDPHASPVRDLPGT